MSGNEGKERLKGVNPGMKGVVAVQVANAMRKWYVNQWRLASKRNEGIPEDLGRGNS